MHNCHKGEFPLLYLGVPIRPTKLKHDDWKGACLSRGGRLIKLIEDWLVGKEFVHLEVEDLLWLIQFYWPGYNIACHFSNDQFG